MRIEQGEAEIRDKLTGQVTQRLVAFKCVHCGGVKHAPTLRSHEFSRCANCDDGIRGGLICEDCIGKPCVHFMRAIEADEARARFRSML